MAALNRSQREKLQNFQQAEKQGTPMVNTPAIRPYFWGGYIDYGGGWLICHNFSGAGWLLQISGGCLMDK